MYNKKSILDQNFVKSLKEDMANFRGSKKYTLINDVKSSSEMRIAISKCSSNIPTEGPLSNKLRPVKNIGKASQKRGKGRGAI